MEKYSCGNGWEWDKSTWPKEVVKFFLVVAIFYFIIGFFSLLAITHGYHISYIPVFHEPWRLAFKLLGLLKEVPNGIGTPI